MEMTILMVLQGCNGSGSYLGGDDVVYLYTPDSDASLNVKFTPQGTGMEYMFMKMLKILV